MRPGCSGSGSGGSSDLCSGVKKEMGGQSRLALLGSGMCGNLVDNVSNSDSVSISSARSTNQSPNVIAQSQMQNGSESSSGTGTRLNHYRFFFVESWVFAILFILYYSLAIWII